MDKVTTAVLAAAVLALPYAADAQLLTQLPFASTPFTGQEVCYIVQGGISKEFFCTAPGAAGVGTVYTIVCGPGLSGGTISTSGTCSLLAIGAGQVVGNASTLSAVPSGVLLIGGAQYSWPSNVVVTAGTYLVANGSVWTDLPTKVKSVAAITGGSGSPSFTLDVQINGTDVVGCNAISVGTVWASATCSAANAFGTADLLTFIVSNVAGTPDLAGPLFTLEHSVR